MTILALRTARKVNGVSRKHGEVSREMWQFLYPGTAVQDVPIGSVTNGVHVPTWLSGGVVLLLNRYLGSNWRGGLNDSSMWDGISDMSDEELWYTHQRLKFKLFGFYTKAILKNKQQ